MILRYIIVINFFKIMYCLWLKSITALLIDEKDKLCSALNPKVAIPKLILHTHGLHRVRISYEH